MGGRCEAEEQWAEHIATGLHRALHVAGILATPPAPPETDTIPVGPSQVLRLTRRGVFVSHGRAAQVGRIVPGETELGSLLDSATYRGIEPFRAPFAQTALPLLRPTVA